MPQELIWSQHPQEAKEHRSFFPFKVSSGGIKRHSLTTHSQTGEVSINVNLAALAAVFLQFATTLAIRFPRLREGQGRLAPLPWTPHQGCRGLHRCRHTPQRTQKCSTHHGAGWEEGYSRSLVFQLQFCSLMYTNATGGRKGAARVFWRMVNFLHKEP